MKKFFIVLLLLISITFTVFVTYADNGTRDFHNINVQIINNKAYITLEETYNFGMYDTNTSWVYVPGKYFKFKWDDNGIVKKGCIKLKHNLIPLDEFLKVINKEV